MRLSQQFIQPLVKAPATLINIKAKSFTWMLAYLIAGLVIFSLFGWLLLENEIYLKNLLLDYLFPRSWHELSEELLLFFYESQAKAVLGNMIIGASLVVASIFLFPIKEYFSAAFEKEAGYANGPIKEFPLIKQAWEETRLLFFYVTAQSVILWIGYYPYPWAKISSLVLSYFFLFFTFGLDFISPTLQRHRLDYPIILKALIKQPTLLCLFGLLYSLPSILLAKWMFSLQTLSFIEITVYLFLANMLLLTMAIPAGTHIASMLIKEIRATSPPSTRSTMLSFIFLGMLLVSSGYLHISLAKSLHHKSQLLKAEYTIDWNSFDYKLPSFSQFFNGKALTNLSFDLEIHNPTKFDIVIEKSQIHIDKLAVNIAIIDLNGFSIPSGETRRVKLQLDSLSDLGKITNFRTLLEDWQVNLYLQVWPGIPFILNIYQSDSDSDSA
ncbi:hypothetical protein ACUR5C_04255 [Aliikangiella sp. IMCC44653]